MILGRLLLAMCGAEAQRTVRSHRCPGPDWQLLLDPGTHCYKKLPHGYPRSVIELKLGVLKLAVYRGWAFEIPKKVSRTRSTCKTSSADKWSRKRTRCWFDGRSQRDLDWCQERWNKYKTDQVKGVRQRSFPIVARDTLAKSSSRLKYNRMSAQTRRLISRPKNESGSEIDCQLTGNPDRPFPGSLFWKIFSLKFIWLDLTWFHSYPLKELWKICLCKTKRWMVLLQRQLWNKAQEGCNLSRYSYSSKKEIYNNG